MFEIDFNKSSTAWGSVAINDSGASDFKIKTINSLGDKIYAHANSDVFIKAKNAIKIQGALNQDVNPVSTCSFYVDNKLLGELKDYRYETPAIVLEKGEYTLSVRAKNNACAHTFWRVTENKDKKPKIAVATCVTSKDDLKDEFIKVTSNYINNVDIYIDENIISNDTANRINTQITKAINNGAEIIAVVDVNTMLDKEFFDEIANVIDSNGLEVNSQRISDKVYAAGKYEYTNRLPNISTGIALTAETWNKLGGFSQNDASVSQNIQKTIGKFTAKFGTVNQSRNIVPYIESDNKEHVVFTSTQDVVPINVSSVNIKIPTKEAVKAKVEKKPEEPEEKEQLTEVPKEDEKPVVKKTTSKTTSKSKPRTKKKES